MGAYQSSELKVLDLDKGVVVKTISKAHQEHLESGINCFYSFIGNPKFVLVKTSKRLTLIDTTTFAATKLAESLFDDNGCSSSVI